LRGINFFKKEGRKEGRKEEQAYTGTDWEWNERVEEYVKLKAEHNHCVVPRHMGQEPETTVYTFSSRKEEQAYTGTVCGIGQDRPLWRIRLTIAESHIM
jgi:hypothetical protein